ncbi:MAG: hypothetical protein RL385_5270, partial [Pseudomonadota bacterium]
WVHHTDRDCRYGSDEYLAALKRLHARPSMSRKGDCWDRECQLFPLQGQTAWRAAAD